MIESEREKTEDEFERKTKKLPESILESGKKGHADEGGQDA